MKTRGSIVFGSSAIEWQFGPCSSSDAALANGYLSRNVYIERCCIPPGVNVLTCRNKLLSEGWKEGAIEIQGHQYCNDFMAFKAMRQVNVKGIS